MGGDHVIIFFVEGGVTQKNVVRVGRHSTF